MEDAQEFQREKKIFKKLINKWFLFVFLLCPVHALFIQ